MPAAAGANRPIATSSRELRGQGPVTASQTAWALLGLMAAGLHDHTAVERGIYYLLDTQRADGGWDEPEFTGTGFPRVFYLAVSLLSDLFSAAGAGQLSSGHDAGMQEFQEFGSQDQIAELKPDTPTSELRTLTELMPPISQAYTVASYVLRQRLRGVKRYPLVLMLEPLFRCNLACAGCGKIQFPAEILRRQLTPEQCLDGGRRMRRADRLDSRRRAAVASAD